MSGPVKNEKYSLRQFHLHWGERDDCGSEHTIHKKAFAGEVRNISANKKHLYNNYLNNVGPTSSTLDRHRPNVIQNVVFTGMHSSHLPPGVQSSPQYESLTLSPYTLSIQCGDRLYTSESDVSTRQILTSLIPTFKDGPRVER